ncbi:hydrophobic surface binding protein A-domain-containing protein [Colletotrichum cereale]|nr:hydrophobic surface binding protein A-domain-containing protein [Colletotrichum cereale]
MHLHHLLSLSLAAVTAFAAPVSIQPSIYKRDLVGIQAALNTINSALQGLDNSVKNTQSITIGTGIQLIGGVSGVKNAIEAATTQVQASEVLNAKDARNLKAATDALTNNVKVTINDVVAKKSLVDSLGATPLVAVGLQDQKTASVALAQALVSKVPPEMNAEAQLSVTALSNVLDEGIGIFGGISVPAAASSGVEAEGVTTEPAAAPPAAANPPSRKKGGKGILGGLTDMLGGILTR